MAKMEMQSSSMAGGKPTASTQAYLDIAEIKENVIVMKDGSLRAVAVVSSVNFSLKSGDEQSALIASYQNFLNSLEFPIQIIMQSRKLDIHTYLDKLRVIMQQQTNELLRMQTQEYIEYVGKLIEFASIMNKTFYVVVPLIAGGGRKMGFMEKIGNLLSPSREIKLKESSFEQAREELSKRTFQVTSGLSGMGLKSILLSTEELVELMYNSYNLNMASPLIIKSVDELGLNDVNSAQ
jgi:type IV secretory pathway VirB4 component